MPASMHYSDGMSSWGACGLPVSKYPHAKDGALVTCKRPGCRVHVPKVEQPRRIALVIAPATATHCGVSHLPQERCRFLSFNHGHWFCASLGSGLPAGGMSSLDVPERLPKCIAAEVKP